MEDDWGSIWEEVAQEDGELLLRDDAAAEKSNTNSEEEILQERDHENVKLVEEADERGNENEENAEEVEGVEEQFEDSAAVEVDIPIEDLVEEEVVREKSVNEVDNEKEEMVEAVKFRGFAR